MTYKIDKIIATVEGVTDTPIGILSTYDATLARDVACYVARMDGPIPFAEIVRMMRYHDHSEALKGFNRVSLALIRCDPHIGQLVRLSRQGLA